MSSGARTSNSLFLKQLASSRCAQRLFEQLHAALDVQRRPHAFELQTELHERDRDRGPHADDHGAGIEHARHRGDVGEHAPDEGVDQLERRDVDEHAVRPSL